MGDPSTPSHDGCGDSQHGFNYNLGPLPPLNSFSGTVDEQIQKAKEWRQRHKPQQADPAALSAQHTPSTSAPYHANATSANISPANASHGASWYNPPSRNAHRYHNRYENSARHRSRRSHQSPSHHAPYNLPRSSPASTAPYHQPPVGTPLYHPHQTAAPGAVGFAPALAASWQTNPAHSGLPPYNHTQPYDHQSSATSHHQYNNQSTNPTYHQPPVAPSNSSHLDQRYRDAPDPYGSQPRGPSQPTAPEYHQQYRYSAQEIDPHYQQYGYTAQPAVPEYPPQYGYFTQPAASKPAAPDYSRQHESTAQPNPYGHQFQTVQLHQGYCHQHHAASAKTPNQSQNPSTTSFSSPPGRKQAVCGLPRAGSHGHPNPQSPSIAPHSSDLTTATSPHTANSSEDEDWKAFEAEVVKAPTAASSALVARNFSRLSLFSSSASRPTTLKPTSQPLESSSTETPAGDAPQSTISELPHSQPAETCSVELSAGGVLRPTVSVLPLALQVVPSLVEVGFDDAVRQALPELTSNLPLEPGVVIPAGTSEQTISDQTASHQPASDHTAESQLRPRAKDWDEALRDNLAIETSIDGFALGTIQYITVNEEDEEMNQDKGKRKASEEPESPAAAKRVKHADSAAPESKPKMPLIPFPEKPAVIEERNGEIEFQVVNNDGSHNSFIILTHLKCIFQKQLPKMPKDYIARLVYDRTHLSIAIVKHPLEVVGGITFRPFKDRKFAEIVFCAISSDQQVKGYGAHLMAHLKDFVQSSSPVMHFLTYADNYAIGYFKKQGFTKEITLEKSVWMGYIKDYEGGTIMQCTMLPRVRYLENGRMLLKQRETVDAKIRATSNSHIVHQPPKQWKNGVVPIDPMSIPAIRNAGWSPEMDELARQPRRGANYNQLLHLLNSMQNHQSAWPFLVPVNRDEVQDYYEVIKEPMDLSTMEQKLEADKYPNPEDFLKDAMLIFKNCRQYNSEGTPYTKMANKLEKYVWTKVREIPEWSHLEEELATKK